VGAPRDRSFARRKARGRMGFSRCARGALVIAFNARSGPIPLRLAYLGCSAGPVLRSQEGSGEEGVFALCARGFGDRLQRSLRTDPAPLGVFGVLRGTGPALAGGVQRFPRSLPKALGFRMPWGVIIPVINSGGVTSKPGFRAVLVGLAIRT